MGRPEDNSRNLSRDRQPDIDSSGLSSLVTAVKRVRSLDGDLQLVCPIGNVRRLIEVVALDRVFVLHEELAAGG